MDPRPSWAGAFYVCLALLATALLASPVHAQSGPIAQWKFDEGSGTTTADSSGNGHTGTLANSPAWLSGRIGNALSFNGGTAVVNAVGGGSINNLYATGMTVSAWINVTAFPATGNNRIIDKDNAVNGWFFGVNSASKLEFWSDNYDTIAKRVSSGSVTASAWKHVTVTWDGSFTGANIHFYIDGVASDGTATNGSGTAHDDSTTPVTLGNRPDLAKGFNGAIDELRVYNRVLTLSEIQALADSTAPSAPTALSATPVSGTQINLAWTASTDNVAVTGYLVERCAGTSCTTFSQVGTPAGTTFNDTGLAPATTYRYRVRATDANANLSGYSSIVNATTSGGADTDPPTAPPSLSAGVASSSQVNLSWTASTDNVGVTGYRIERCQGAGCTSFVQVHALNATSYSDPGLAASTTYRYQVRARDAAGNWSNPSSIATVTTPNGSTDCI